MKISNRFYNTIMRASKELTGDYVSIEEMNWNTEAPMEFGINWGCYGTVDIATAKDFATKLAKATEIVNFLNGLQLRIDWDSKGENLTKENYANALNELKDILDNQLIFGIHELVERVGK